MASFVYTPAKAAIMRGELNFQEAGDDLRVLLVMTNTTADTEQDMANIADITTLDEMDGANYVRKALANQTVTEVDASDLAKLTCDNITWSTLGVGTRQVAGMVLYKHVTNDADAVLIAYIDSGGFPFTANGGDVTVTINADGLLQLT